MPPPTSSRVRRIVECLRSRVDEDLHARLRRRVDRAARRDEQMAAGQAISILLDTYREAGYTHARLQTAGDREVCPSCRVRHGRVYPLERAPRVLAEICENERCRCVYVPITTEAG